MKACHQGASHRRLVKLGISGWLEVGEEDARARFT